MHYGTASYIYCQISTKTVARFDNFLKVVKSYLVELN